MKTETCNEGQVISNAADPLSPGHSGAGWKARSAYLHNLRFPLLNHTAALKNPGKTKLFFSRVLNMEGGLELILFIFFILVMRKMRPREM